MKRKEIGFSDLLTVYCTCL